ncbi:TIP120-domain-containing protein [Aulographum hederae CBS 113979]|uniref:TIP120-domain-containing protein n=1 Tax=Aulographum hederae CBS 113979 TaxID=1176131 RepID=A0A6G1GNU7_9PEZI|nr:TIP120-domain-containing protein [Aulographum hederae CBS 113979]
MAPNSNGAPPTAHSVAHLTPRLYDNDVDFRYMALNDLYTLLSTCPPSMLQHDHPICAKLVDGFMHTLNDKNGEVQNMTIKCLGPFVNKAPETILCPLIDKISSVEAQNIVDNSVPALALRAIVVSFPRPRPGIPRSKAVNDAYNAISKALIPRLVGHNIISTGRKDLPAVPRGMLAADLESGSDSNAMDALTAVASCFGSMLQEAEVDALQKVTFDVIESERVGSVLKKKAVTAIATLCLYFTDMQLSQFLSQLIECLRNSHLTSSKQKMYITILGSMAGSIPRKFGPYLKTLAPFVLDPLSESSMDEDMAGSEDEGERDPETDDVREAGLIAIESFLANCSADMRPHTQDCINAATRFLKHDPNLADDDFEAEEMDEEDALAGDDFEEEQGYDDDDDNSWKVRRSAAKVLYTLISTRSNGDLLDDGTLYNHVAPSLVDRFGEREDSVRLEVLSTLALLIRKTGGKTSSTHSIADATMGAMGPPPSRKRRRGGSDVSMVSTFDPNSRPSLPEDNGAPERSDTPLSGPQSSLSQITPSIISGVSSLLTSGSLPIKQASIVLLRDLVIAQPGSLDNSIGPVVDAVVQAIQMSGSQGGSSGGSSTATTTTFRVEALQFLSATAESHSAQTIQPYLGKIVPTLVSAVQEKYTKVSIEALATMEQLIKALTSSASPSSSPEAPQQLAEIFNTLTDRIRSSYTDIDVRKGSVHALGILLGRTSGNANLLSADKRTEALDLLMTRLQNELTRIETIRAIENIASLAQSKNEFSPAWVRQVSLEFGSQLRKSSRTLRGTSIQALKTVVMNPATRASLDTETMKEIVVLLLPLLRDVDPDLHLVGPALLILATFVTVDAGAIMDEEVISSFCHLLKVPLSSTTLETMLIFVRTVGEQNVGARLMKALLQDVGVSGIPDQVGKMIGNLLVAGSGQVGVKLEDFVNELRSQQDDPRKILALGVLGEAGLRMGPSSPLEPQLFMKYFSVKSERVPLIAAVSLGRAGASNIKTYLPAILGEMSKPQGHKYLLLHTVREILQYDGAEADIHPYTRDLWDNLIQASSTEDNKTIGAECIGRLAIIDPKTYLPQLQNFLTDSSPVVRGMCISAFRYTFADTDETYDAYLAPIVIGMLTTMLNENDLDNRRLALTTLNSATHNKPDLVLPHLEQLLPLAMKETVINPNLIREVTMGPFKHKVDDGLEIRKSAYETLYALLETAFSRLDVPAFYERIVAGISDEHEIRILCTLMLSKLVTLAPEETKCHLHVLAETFRAMISVKPKDTTVKQELEKMNEANKGVLKVGVLITKAFPSAEVGSQGQGKDDPQVKAWAGFWEWVKKDHSHLLRSAEEEVREKDR